MRSWQSQKRYLVRRQLASAGLTEEQCKINEGVLLAIIRDYTREAGVRNLERQIGAICRHVAMRIAEGSATRVDIAVTDLQVILGSKRFEQEIAMRTSVPGVATGLAWTPAGGDILFVEATSIPGRGKLILTGQLAM
jgi:ATP-dependent Lon protease